MDSNGKLGFNEQDYQLLSEKERDINDKKLDKVTSSYIANSIRAYTVNDKGEQTITSNSPNTIIYRDSQGKASISTPIDDYSIANKKYVDDIKTELLEAIQALREELSK